MEGYVVSTCTKVRKMLALQATSSMIGSMTVDGWSAALGCQILDIPWYFLDDNCLIKSIPAALLNTDTSFKSSEQLLSIVIEIIRDNSVIGADCIRVHAVKSNDEAAVAFSGDLLTYCVV